MQRRDALQAMGAFATAAALGGDTMKSAETESTKNLKLARTYLAAWGKKDVGAIGEQLHPDVHFKAPLSETSGKKAFLAATQQVLPILQSLNVRSTFASGNQVVAIYDFNCAAPIGVCRTAELMTFQDGLIASVELFFDATPFAKLPKP